MKIENKDGITKRFVKQNWYIIFASDSSTAVLAFYV